MGKPMTPRPMNATLADIGKTSVDGVWGLSTFEHSRHISGCGVAHDDAGRARGAADVRRENDVGKGRVSGMELRLAFEHVEARAGDALGLQRGDKSGIVDHAAARAV